MNSVRAHLRFLLPLLVVGLVLTMAASPTFGQSSQAGNCLLEPQLLEGLKTPFCQRNIITERAFFVPVEARIGRFWGGDVGEGLDLDGDFVYAVNFAGPHEDLLVRDATFVDFEVSNIVKNGRTGELVEFHGIGGPEGAPLNFGDSGNDDAIEFIMRDSHTGESTSEDNAFNTIQFPNLEEEVEYKVQLLFNDPYTDHDRDFVIRIPSANGFPFDTIIENFHPQGVQGYFGPAAAAVEGLPGPKEGNRNKGVVVTAQFMPPFGGGTTLMIGLDNFGLEYPNFSSDEGTLVVEAVIAAITVEREPGPLPEPDGPEPPDPTTGPTPMAGDANNDGMVDTSDVIQILAGGKFETGAAATFADGDFDGDGVFTTGDIVAMLAVGLFETGPYRALQDPPAGSDEVVVSYDAANGNVSVNATRPITSISLESDSGIFTGIAAANLGGPFDVDTDVKVFKAVFGGDFSEVDFGTVAAAGLPKDLLLNDLTASGSLAGGGGTYGPDVQLNYIPEPSTFWLGLLATAALVGFRHKRRTAE